MARCHLIEPTRCYVFVGGFFFRPMRKKTWEFRPMKLDWEAINGNTSSTTRSIATQPRGFLHWAIISCDAGRKDNTQTNKRNMCKAQSHKLRHVHFKHGNFVAYSKVNEIRRKAWHKRPKKTIRETWRLMTLQTKRWSLNWFPRFINTPRCIQSCMQLSVAL